ncbi:c-type cytochrome biogenesis protein CcmI [Kordiimonas sp. SCSIO 12610]|uniref:c-type cytochrome biogenesis protein CcmI n=1 Tax=Kordiimonas sp. SCSIO 12610 TaxID=2829597 RepID=UPI00210B03F2|nr:c-type cytochrome biogenesis protein CcmI [Kordiimonas sp. SCSIO 12610]UTW55625.1 c-type cytochrome biogenesis protein CcmI [Kordiimonas sp. SCSIO 12610]
MIWLLICAVLLVAIGSIFFVGARRDKAANPLDYYKNQLKELDADIERGLIDPATVASAKLEIERRILRANAANPHNADNDNQSTSKSYRFELVIILMILVGSFALYTTFGSPEVESATAARANLRERTVAEGGPTLGQAIEQIETHLAKNPDDATGWEVLTTSTRAVGDHARSIAAYNQLIRLQPDNIDWYIKRLEAYIGMANGQITPAANLLLSNIIDLSPEHPAGQFYLGLAYKQSNQLEGAYQVWQALLQNSQPNAPWYAIVQQQLEEIGPQLNKTSPSGPSRADIEAVANLSAEDREAFINSMIDRLKNKLSENPNDIDGWRMLARALVQQGKKSEAIQALEGAITAVHEENQENVRQILDNLVENNDF